VSNASDDFPEPDRPVKTIRRLRGSSRSTFLRLCSLAPQMVMASATPPSYREHRPAERMFAYAPSLPVPASLSGTAALVT